MLSVLLSGSAEKLTGGRGEERRGRGDSREILLFWKIAFRLIFAKIQKSVRNIFFFKYYWIFFFCFVFVVYCVCWKIIHFFFVVSGPQTYLLIIVPQCPLCHLFLRILNSFFFFKLIFSASKNTLCDFFWTLENGSLNYTMIFLLMNQLCCFFSLPFP